MIGWIISYIIGSKIVDAYDEITTKEIKIPSCKYGHNKANWMTDHFEILKDKSLTNITLPGTHDSGTYSLSFSGALGIGKFAAGLSGFVIEKLVSHGFFECQNKNLYNQLMDGVRYFDLRPAYIDGEYYIYHGESFMKGPSFKDVLGQIKNYMDSVKNGKEFVLLNISHFKNFNDSRHSEFSQLLENSLNSYLLEAAGNYTVANISYKSIFEYSRNKGHSCVAVLYNDSKGKYPFFKPGGQGFTGSLLNIYDEYADKTDVDEMIKNQGNKLKKQGKPGGNSSQLFLLSWTLTQPSDLDASRILQSIGAMSIKGLAEKANRHLPDFLYSLYYDKNKKCYDSNRSNKINIIYVDFYEESKAVDWAIMLNHDTFPAE